MPLFKFRSKKEEIMEANNKYKEGQEVKIILDGMTTKVTILKVFSNTVIVKSKDGECKTCFLSEIL